MIQIKYLHTIVSIDMNKNSGRGCAIAWMLCCLENFFIKQISLVSMNAASFIVTGDRMGRARFFVRM